MPAGLFGPLAHPLSNHPPTVTYHMILEGEKGANLGLEVAQFLLGLHILGTNTHVNVTDPNSFSRNIQKVGCCCFFSLNSSDGAHRGLAENKLWETLGVQVIQSETG